jgi:SAM-dependent methyltransferase
MNCEKVSMENLWHFALQQYETYYQVPGFLRETDAFYLWVLDKLGAHKGTLLDIACGEGHMIYWARKRGIDAYGLDFSTIAVQTANQLSGRIVVAVGDGENLPFAGDSFDFVTNLGSLEHFLNPERGLQEMKRVLKPGGRIAILVPNSYYLLDIIWHVWRRGFPVSHSQTIERFATAGQWRHLILQAGLKIVKEYKYNLCFPRTVHDLGWYRKSPLKLTFPLLSPITPFNLSYSFLFICVRSE